MPGCGDSSSPGGHSALVKDMPGLASPLLTPCSSPENRESLARDLTVVELEELIEKCVRRVLQGEDIKREYAKLRAAEKQ